MPLRTKQELLQTQVGERLLSDWNSRWEPLTYAFTKGHPELKGVVGLIRMILNGKTTYIARATETKGGIAKGMQRLAGPEQTGNSGVGAQRVRKEKDRLRVEILRVDDQHNPTQIAKDLKTQMRYLHKPTGDKPFQRHLEKLRAGKLKATKVKRVPPRSLDDCPSK